MDHQLIISLGGEKKPLCCSFSSSTAEALRVGTVAYAFQQLWNVAVPDQLWTSFGGRILKMEDKVFASSSSPSSSSSLQGSLEKLASVNLLFKLYGGKGGFGANLRSQGGRMASQKTTNFDACRDLSGRRLKTISDAQKLAQFMEHEEDRKRARDEEITKKIEEGLKEPETKKHRFDDTQYLEDHEKVVEDVKDAVARALLKNGSSSKKAASAVAAPSLKKDFAEKTEKQDGKSVLKKKKGMAWAEDVSSDDSDGEDETVDIKKSKGKGKA